MMMIKLIGGLLVILSAGLLGIAAAKRLGRRPREIKKLRATLQLLETEIIYGATPLPLAFNKISNKVDKNWQVFYGSIENNLKSGQFYTVSAAWNDAVDKLPPDTGLKLTDIMLLKGFGNVLGYSDKSDQKKHFDLFYIQLSQNEVQAEDERKKSEKMYQSLGFLVGMAIFIILI